MSEALAATTPLRAALRFVRHAYGIEIPEYRWPLLAAELDRVSGTHGASVAVDRLLAHDADVCDRILDAITVPETFLFRHVGHFRILKSLAAERERAGRTIHVLCAGCSSGEEAWSVAAVLASTRPAHPSATAPPSSAHVVGWDVSEKRLLEARRGVYREWSARTGLHGFDSFFERNAAGWRVGDAIRSRVRFSKVNLVGALPGEVRFDAVLFRNVAIYWDVVTASAVMDRLAGMLTADGLLMVGPSDPGAPCSPEWTHVIEHGVRYFRRNREMACDLERAERDGGRVVHVARAAPARLAAAAPRGAEAPRAPRRAAPRLPKVADEPALRQPPEPSPPESTALRAVESLANAGLYAPALDLLRSSGERSIEGRRWEGILLLNLGEATRAIEALRQCVFLEPDRAEHRRWLALAYRAAGRDADAEREHRNAAELAEP